MNPLKCDEMDPINFLIAAQQVFSSVEALRTHSLEEGVSAHDIYTILQQRFPADSKKPWQEVEPLIQRKAGTLVIDDTTMDKPYDSQMVLLTSRWSGKHG